MTRVCLVETWQQHARVPLLVFGVRITEPLFADSAANSRRKSANFIAG